MSTFALVPGAGGAAWYGHRVVPQLLEEGRHAIAVDLPGDDLVVQSPGGFTAPLAAATIPIQALVW